MKLSYAFSWPAITNIPQYFSREELIIFHSVGERQRRIPIFLILLNDSPLSIRIVVISFGDLILRESPHVIFISADSVFSFVLGIGTRRAPASISSAH